MARRAVGFVMSKMLSERTKFKEYSGNDMNFAPGYGDGYRDGSGEGCGLAYGNYYGFKLNFGTGCGRGNGNGYIDGSGESFYKIEELIEK